ncbi:response regulator transcription factor [Flavobacteriaceae bacterium TP-CH-4]|uniref:Response regulator transcription factor n=1 Tax=Pelagihabitans pacificus TaxID=2696054 RepID=A0A967AZX9_9FLAO|nr:LytTR family DNA-binding domain-containing protein [Pelagihabitans pacificus]NHF59591.1 response regulator transcription factor [Pelagihabitans pacificus]
MNCIIIEDQPPAQRILKKFIEDVGTLQLTGIFPDALQAVEYLKTNKVDLLFLDIHLPKISGIEFLRTMPHRPHVILTTAFPDYALEGYDLNVVDYLLKPFSFQRFLQAVAKVPSVQEAIRNSTENQPSREEIYIKSGHEHVKIAIQDIFYLHSDSDYTEIHTATKKLLSTEPLRFWLQVLEQHSFSRVHKSYIINTRKIERISGNLIYMAPNFKIPVGRAFKEDFMKKILT